MEPGGSWRATLLVPDRGQPRITRNIPISTGQEGLTGDEIRGCSCQASRTARLRSSLYGGSLHKNDDRPKSSVLVKVQVCGLGALRILRQWLGLRVVQTKMRSWLQTVSRIMPRKPVVEDPQGAC